MTEVDSLTETVARAIYAADGTDADWKWQPHRWAVEYDKERYYRLARAAIQAMKGET